MEPSTADAMDSRSSSPGLAGPMVTDAELHESVGARHRRIDPERWEDIYVVGDVHGCYEELSHLIESLEVRENDLVVFVGDLVRKGPDSKAVVEFVRRHENMVSVRGNNENKLIEDRKTLKSLESDDRSYLESLPVVVSWDDVMVVHGGVDPTRPLNEQDVYSLLCCRAIPPENGYAGPFWFERYQGSPRVFFGHTVLDEPVTTEWVVGLDTGCVYGGALTAYDYYADTLHSVPARRVYETRADRKILNDEVLDT